MVRPPADGAGLAPDGSGAAARLTGFDRFLLAVGASSSGVMADDFTPNVLGACEAMLAAGLLRRGRRAGAIRTYHTTGEGMKHL